MVRHCQQKEMVLHLIIKNILLMICVVYCKSIKYVFLFPGMDDTYKYFKCWQAEMVTNIWKQTSKHKQQNDPKKNSRNDLIRLYRMNI